MSPERTPDGRYIVVNGRRWRATDPELPERLAKELRSELGRARSGIRLVTNEGDRRALRDRVQIAKEGLGERGTPWWEMPIDERCERAEARLAHLRDEEEREV